MYHARTTSHETFEREKNKFPRRKSLAVCDHMIFFYYGTGLYLLLEWCGGAVHNFQARDIERALASALACGPWPIFDLINEAMR